MSCPFVVEQTPSALKLRLPVLRNAGFKVVFLFLSLVFVVMPVLAVWHFFTIAAQFGWFGQLFLLLLPLPVMLLVILIAIAVALYSFYGLTNSLQVDISPHRILSKRRVMGMPVKTATASNLDVQKIQFRRTGSSSSAGETTEYYSVRALVLDNRVIPIADSLKGMDAAIRLAEHAAKLLCCEAVLMEGKDTEEQERVRARHPKLFSVASAFSRRLSTPKNNITRH